MNDKDGKGSSGRDLPLLGTKYKPGHQDVCHKAHYCQEWEGSYETMPGKDMHGTSRFQS